MEKMKNAPPIAPKWQDFPEIELYMDQVISVLEKYLSPYFPDEKCITPTMINNYVKQKLIPPPQNKRYGKGQLTRLFMICILKSFMQLSDVRLLLENLSLTLSEKELFDLFTEKLDRSLKWIAEKTEFPKVPTRAPEKALHAALTAFSAIVYSRIIFRLSSAEFAPLAEEEKKEEKKKEKKEKK